MSDAAACAIALDSSVDAEALRRELRRNGRLRWPGFLAGDGADALRTHLIARRDWRTVIGTEQRIYEIDSAAYDALPNAQRALVERQLEEERQHSFRFRFDTIRVSDEADARAGVGGLLAAFAELMNRAETLALLRKVTGEDRIRFLDAQATRYRAGHFLGSHDDDVQGKCRLFAYVLGLTPGWDPAWGGTLDFTEGREPGRFTPSFNTLSLFRVPQDHCVAPVVPDARDARISVTGWLRA